MKPCEDFPPHNLEPNGAPYHGHIGTFTVWPLAPSDLMLYGIPFALHAAGTVAYSQSLKHTNLFLELASTHAVAFTWSSLLPVHGTLAPGHWSASPQEAFASRTERAGASPVPGRVPLLCSFRAPAPFMLTCPLSPHLTVNSWGHRPCSIYSLINDQCIRKYPIKCFC